MQLVPMVEPPECNEGAQRDSSCWTGGRLTALEEEQAQPESPSKLPAQRLGTLDLNAQALSRLRGKHKHRNYPFNLVLDGSFCNDSKISDNIICLDFQNVIVMVFPKQNSVLDGFPLCPNTPPPSKMHAVYD